MPFQKASKNTQSGGCCFFSKLWLIYCNFFMDNQCTNSASPRADGVKFGIGSLSTHVFEMQMVTGSELFSLLTCPHTTTLTLPSIFSLLEPSSIKIWETILF